LEAGRGNSIIACKGKKRHENTILREMEAVYPQNRTGIIFESPAGEVSFGGVLRIDTGAYDNIAEVKNPWRRQRMLRM
jgi:hypothetical protein